MIVEFEIMIAPRFSIDQHIIDIFPIVGLRSCARRRDTIMVGYLGALIQRIILGLRVFAEIELVIKAILSTIGSGVVATIFSRMAINFPFFQKIPPWVLFYVPFSIMVMIFAIVFSLFTISFLNRYRLSAAHFLTIAANNCVVDAELFQSLFADLTKTITEERNCINSHPVIGVAMRHATVNALQLTKRNVRDILNELRDINSAYTGKACATCLKLPSSKRDSVIIIERDGASKTDRGRNIAQSINGNTAFVQIESQGKDHFASNDLKALAAKDQYSNPRNGWQKLYNSSMVVPLPSPMDQGSNIGFLCIDSLNGRLDDPQCLHYAKEVAYRLSAMVYRLGALNAILRRGFERAA